MTTVKKGLYAATLTNKYGPCAWEGWKDRCNELVATGQAKNHNISLSSIFRKENPPGSSLYAAYASWVNMLASDLYMVTAADLSVTGTSVPTRRQIPFSDQAPTPLSSVSTAATPASTCKGKTEEVCRNSPNCSWIVYKKGPSANKGYCRSKNLVGFKRALLPDETSLSLVDRDPEMDDSVAASLVSAGTPRLIQTPISSMATSGITTTTARRGKSDCSQIKTQELCDPKTCQWVTIKKGSLANRSYCRSRPTASSLRSEASTPMTNLLLAPVDVPYADEGTLNRRQGRQRVGREQQQGRQRIGREQQFLWEDLDGARVTSSQRRQLQNRQREGRRSLLDEEQRASRRWQRPTSFASRVQTARNQRPDELSSSGPERGNMTDLEMSQSPDLEFVDDAPIQLEREDFNDLQQQQQQQRVGASLTQRRRQQQPSRPRSASQSRRQLLGSVPNRFTSPPQQDLDIDDLDL